MGRAHDVLTRENWESAALRDLVNEAVSPFRSERQSRFHFGGPDVRVPPRMALALSMAIQELCTNAVKHGALSNENGRVTIDWSTDAAASPAVLTMRWQECGGPPVEVPTRRGFGSRLIERGLAQELGGEVAIEFGAAGVTCTIRAPLPQQPRAESGGDVLAA